MKNNKLGKAKIEDAVVCEQCGRKIPKERLKAVPDTVLCVHCAAEVEHEEGTDKVVPLVDYDPSELLDAISSDD
jgi:RNA polymerase-binding transcription factor DksA